MRDVPQTCGGILSFLLKHCGIRHWKEPVRTNIYIHMTSPAVKVKKIEKTCFFIVWLSHFFLRCAAKAERGTYRKPFFVAKSLKK
jgi:hypothetical protein